MRFCRSVEKVKAAAWKPAQPKPANSGVKPLDIYWVPKEFYEQWYALYDRENVKALGVAFPNTNEILIREGYVPMGYRLNEGPNTTKTWSHSHYMERLGKMPGKTYWDVPINNAAQEIHLHECGHAITGWMHNEGNPVMFTDGQYAKDFGLKLTPVQRDALFSQFNAQHPTIRMIRWTPDQDHASIMGDDQ